ncbi:MAG TPA: DPP IV N-terminal domain-containing protein [Actinomycetota bacterium]|nr:DPP IV N-terminal domain-containing protein [Actinomycetota bacterium]
MSTRMPLSIALVVLMASLTAGSPTASAAFPGENGLIAYRHEAEIFTMTGDGSNKVAVPNTAASAAPTDPAWSADGNRLAFVRNQDIWIINASGTGARNLTNTPTFLDAEPSWSPDGSEIAFGSYRDSNWEIYVVRSSDGGGERQLTQDTDPSRRDPSTFPAWSPDGSQIAFFSDRPGAFGLYVMPADTGDPESFLVATSATNNYPSWFPDGSKLAYTNDTELWVMDADGTDQTELTTGARVAFGVSVSPDGNSIAFTSGRDNNYEIYVADADGGNQVNITNSPGTDDRLPDWAVPGTDDGGVQNGTDEDDQLDGSGSSDTVYAGAGNDVIETLGGADIAYGEEGNDTLNGGAGNDKLYGDFGPAPSAPNRSGRRFMQEEEPVTADDVIKGGGGADVAVGGPGSDAINGGPGIDRMKGGPGIDTCVFSSKKEVAKSSSCERKKLNF